MNVCTKLNMFICNLIIKLLQTLTLGEGRRGGRQPGTLWVLQNGEDVQEHLPVVTANIKVCEASVLFCFVFLKANKQKNPTKTKFDGSILHSAVSWWWKWGPTDVWSPWLLTFQEHRSRDECKSRSFSVPNSFPVGFWIKHTDSATLIFTKYILAC